MIYDFIIVGGGIVGLATGYSLIKKYPDASLLILEKESTVAAHQTGRNSGVIHSGIYYKPGSLKAKYAKEGAKRLIEYCKENEIKYDICGKLIIATEEEELPNLESLYLRGKENGLTIEKIDMEQIREIEPHANGIAAIKVPMTGIVNYQEVALSLAANIEERGGVLETDTVVKNIIENDDGVIVQTSKGNFNSKYFFNCAGLYSDRIARLAGVDPGMKIIPFRGEYYKLKEDKANLVKNLIYPVPNPQFPFLGVHLTRMINGETHAGPNAVLAFKREGYKKTDFNLRDLAEVLSYRPFWKIVKKHLRYGIMEMYRSVNRRVFLKSLQRLVPEVQEGDLIPAEAGIRAQALTNKGDLIDDFMIIKGKRSIHVCNAPSPAATASLAIGEEIVQYLNELESFN